jgi:ubiquinone/menaquinone biosynthesis C-methylase UbiE
MSLLSHLVHHREGGEESAPETQGLVITWALRYDLMVRSLAWLLLGGSEHALRQMNADLAQLQPGETVLDVGCGTGTMAIVAKQRIGETGRVYGIDPSVQLIARARRKAARRGLAIDFQIGLIEQLAFPDQSFDVVLSTMMMHHLPDDLKRQGLREIARVLNPGGRLLVLDFRRSVHGGSWNSDIQDQPALMKEAGFSQIETGETRFRGLGFVLGRINSAGEEMAGL